MRNIDFHIKVLSGLTRSKIEVINLCHNQKIEDINLESRKISGSPSPQGHQCLSGQLREKGVKMDDSTRMKLNRLMHNSNGNSEVNTYDFLLNFHFYQVYARLEIDEAIIFKSHDNECKDRHQAELYGA